jgi:hypothetical protein
MASTNAAKKRSKNSAKRGTHVTRDLGPTKKQLDRRCRIIELAKSAAANATATRNQAQLSIEQAIECGKLLIIEKHSLKDQGIKGKWREYFDLVFGKHLPIRTATHWMKLAHDSKNMPIENVTRKGMLSLELFPSKIQSSVKSAMLPKFTNHIALINRFVVWRRQFGERIIANTLTQSELNQLRLDFAPVTLFVEQLKAGTLIEAAQSSNAS